MCDWQRRVERSWQVGPAFTPRLPCALLSGKTALGPFRNLAPCGPAPGAAPGIFFKGFGGRTICAATEKHRGSELKAFCRTLVYNKFYAVMNPLVHSSP
ncbi:hypothetical protein Y1Q_0019308 [Alligator mississippiensis]|uniref:Uncharacterized protein n=1 Tax=Alligator mississippiensis TaxID=8496 RepID=A0A151MQU1_ALLMI|nr:hypothetical protein Y1Q_0019308 [Alligator mississippiensis]